MLYGRCDEDLGVPFQPWIEALGQIVDVAPTEVLVDHVQDRGAHLARWVPKLWAATLVGWLVCTWSTAQVAPLVLAALPHKPFAWVGMALIAGGVGAVVFALLQRRELLAFIGSSLFIAGLLVATVACLHPVLLRSTVDSRFDLTVENAASGSIAMQSGLIWWFPGLLLAVGYFVWVLKHFRGKVVAARDGEGY